VTSGSTCSSENVGNCLQEYKASQHRISLLGVLRVCNIISVQKSVSRINLPFKSYETVVRTRVSLCSSQYIDTTVHSTVQ
jgi:hypothetical protein